MTARSMLDCFSRGRTPRTVQIEALARIQQALVVEGKRVFVLDAPTGSGKSEIGMAVARYFGGAFITSPRNLLVDQYEKDFPELSAIKGKSNYLCSDYRFLVRIPEYERTCETADDIDEKGHRAICHDYIPIRNTFWRGPISVTNVDFMYWAHLPVDLAGGNDYRSILIIDECHNLEEKLCELGKVQITRRQVERIGMSADYFGYVGKDHAAAQNFVEEFLAYVTTALAQERFSGKEKRMFARKAASLQLTLEVGDWIHWYEKDPETEREALVLKPLNGHVAAGRLFERADKLLFMSATVGKVEQFLAGLNLRESDASWHKADSEFPVGKRLVQLFTGAYLTSKNEDRALPPIIDGCRQVLNQFPDYKGAILVPSYALASKLAAHLGPRILTHTPDNKDEVIARHRQSPEPTVLLGVCLHEGLDLKDDLARFLILPKVLYPYLGDPYIAERTLRSPDWYLRQATLAMVQAAGRVVRTPTDWAEIVILDSCFANLLHRPDMFPRWFWEAIRVNGKKPPQRVSTAPVAEMDGS